MNYTIFWEKVNKIAGYFIMGLALFFIVFIAARQTIHLWMYSRYTIATPIEIYYSGGIRKLIYQYSVDGKLLKRQENYHGGEIGKKYYVKYSSQDPMISDFLENMPVSDSIIIVPQKGWNKIPDDL